MGIQALSILILCFCLAGQVNCRTPQCNEEERRVLLAFKHSVEDPFNSLSSWTGHNCCHGWIGIACHKHSGFITVLNIRDMKLSPKNDSINPSLWKLRNLQILDMSFNNFSGQSIPAELGQLNRLKYLELSYSGFAGFIPWQLGHLTNLQHFGLERDIFTPFSATVSAYNMSWIQNMTELHYLNVNGVDLREASEDWVLHVSVLSELYYLSMAGCRLLGTIPSSVLKLKNLEHLDLSYNTFSYQSMPQWLSGMKSLVSLNLSGCALRGPITALPNLQELVLDRNYYLNASLERFLNGQWSNLRRLSVSSCNLEGVMTDSMTSIPYLAHLDLSNNQIQGSIPACIGDMRNLRFLDLSFNNITGRVPVSLGLLSNITHLDLRHNQLRGSIPDQLSSLSSLQYLGLGHNQLNGSTSQDFSLPSGLSTFDVSFNSFSNHISEKLFHGLDQLKVLLLSNSGLNVSMMDGASVAFSLEQLSMSSCNIQGSIPQWISTQDKMVFLDLSNNKLHGEIPQWLWSLPSLAQLNLSNNNLVGALPKHIHLQAQIGPRVVDLHSNQLSGSLPLSFGLMEVLDLSNNQLSGTISSEVFGDHWNINFLSLSNNSLSGEVPKSLAGSRSLEILDLSNNNFSGDLQERFINCSSMVVLNMENNCLSGELPFEMGNMKNLQTFHMTNNTLSGPLPSSLQNCTALEIVELGNNRINGSIPTWIQYLKRLRILILTGNKLQGSIPKEITMASNIQILDLSHNYLSGVIPHEFVGFKGMIYRLQPTGPFILRYVIGFGMTMSPYKADAEGGLGLFYGADVEIMSKGQDMHFDQIPSIVTSMDLSNNNLQGQIPSELGSLTGLVTLNLSSNNLQGSIPETLGNIKQLESLDLSSNQLSGQIPQELATIDFLQYLAVRNNRLSGMIPQGIHFTTFDASSFSGNPDLCGFQLNKSCYRNPNPDKTPSSSGDAGEGGKVDLWWEIGVGLSYGLGFSCVVTLIVLFERWRNNLFVCFDRVIVILDQWLGTCGSRR